MKIIITESKLEKAAINWLSNEFIDVEPYNAKGFPNHIFFQKDGEIEFEYRKDIEQIRFKMDICDSLESYFGVDYGQAQNLLKLWGEEILNLKIYKVRFASSSTHNDWDVIETKIRYENNNN
jgi:hypothetical protein